MNVLILTGKFGLGHYSVAGTLVQEIKNSNPTAVVAVKDLFQYAMPKQSDMMYRAYSCLVQKGGRFYNAYYRRMEQAKQAPQVPFAPYFLKMLGRLIAEQSPDVIISTFPFCSQVVSLYKEKYRMRIPFITCITDITSHSAWINPNTDAYLAASEMTRRDLIERGVDPDTVYINGIPVNEQFKAMNRSGQMSLVRKKEDKQLLIMGGGLGLLPKDKRFYEELNELDHVKTTVITGKNQAFYNKIHGKYENIEVIGYTDQVYKYMQRADLIISKPGGITLFETIYSELPILVLRPFLQQEVNNAAFVESRDIGIVFWKEPQDFVKAINEVLQNEVLLNKLRCNMSRIKDRLDSDSLTRILEAVEKKEACA